MTLFAFIGGIAVGIVLMLAANYLWPEKVDDVTADAAQKVKDKL